MNDPQPIKPDAGKLVHDLDEIVTKYVGSTDEAYPAYLALLDVNKWFREYIAAFEDDSSERKNADYHADNAKDTIRRESNKRNEAAAHAARVERARELAAIVPAPISKPSDTTPQGGGGRGNRNDHNNGNDNGGNNRSNFFPWLVVAAALIIGAFVIAWAVTRDNDDGNISKAEAAAILKKAEELRNGNNDSGSDDSNGGDSNDKNGSSGSGKAIADLGQVFASSDKGGGPNLDGIDTGDCEVQQVGSNGVRVRSGVLGICTWEFDPSKLPAGWQLAVDSVYHEVNGTACTGCTQGFELSKLGTTVKVVIRNGAAVAGPSDVANARYCTALREGIAFGHDNAHQPLPLVGWTCR